MKEKFKEKFKTFSEGPGPYIIMAGVGITALTLTYITYSRKEHEIYIGYLKDKSNLFAQALDTTTNSVIDALER